MKEKIAFALALLLLSTSAFATGADGIFILAIWFGPIPSLVVTSVFCGYYKKYSSIVAWGILYVAQTAILSYFFSTSGRLKDSLIYMGVLLPIAICIASIGVVAKQQRLRFTEVLKVLGMGILALVVVTFFVLALFGIGI